MTSKISAVDLEAERRIYWSTQMDAAHVFMQAVQRVETEECLEPVVSLASASESAGAEVVFASAPHEDGAPRIHVLRQGLVADFVAAAQDFNSRGWILKVEDAYRTRAMQRDLARSERVLRRVYERVRWETGEARPSLELVRRRLGSLVAATPGTATHMSASAVDISVLNRDDGQPIDLGASYLELSPLTPMRSPFVSDPARAHREQVLSLMAEHGFLPYPFEFWHYSAKDRFVVALADECKRASYGPVDVDESTGEVSPLHDIATPLNSELDLVRALEEMRL